MLTETQTKNQIRKKMRLQRQMLSPQSCEAAGVGVYRHLKKYAPFFHAKKVACYLPSDGEVSLLPVIEALWARKKTACLPILFGQGDASFGCRQLTFGEYFIDSAMKKNRFGILEPNMPFAKQIKPMALDIVLMPLVAFDHRGNRVGMGGGFYDRSFSFLLRRFYTKRPKLIGVAHSFQEVENLKSDKWDVPLDAIVTESQLILVK